MIFCALSTGKQKCVVKCSVVIYLSCTVHLLYVSYVTSNQRMKVLTLSSLILYCQCLDIGSLVTQAEKEVTSERLSRVSFSSGHSRGKKVTQFSSMMSDRNAVVRRTFDRFLKVDFEFLRCESILSGGPASKESMSQVSSYKS